MKMKNWTREGEKTKDALSWKESAYTDRIIIVNEQTEKSKYHGRNLTS
jgi:hypothetical protein